MSYSMAFAFPDGSNSFVHGYEAGVLGALMHLQRESIDTPVPYHEENLQLFQRMADYYGYTMTQTSTEVEGWVDVLFELKPEAPKVPHLRLIKG